MQKTKIEFADYSYNPIVGCSKVSDGCTHCFAEAMVNRFPHFTGIEMRGNENAAYPEPIGWDGKAYFFPERLEEPFHLRQGKDRPHRISVCSMSDLFHESLSNEQIAAVFGVMAATPKHQYIVLTKRMKRASDWYTWISCASKRNDLATNVFAKSEARKITTKIPLCRGKYEWPLQNVIICASVENQQTANERIPLLLQIPARWRGVSVEPMLSSIELQRNRGWLSPFQETDAMLRRTPRLDLIICGSETGPGKRPFKDEWALDLRDQCKASGTPFFFKKDGNGNGALCGIEYHEWIGE